jgi:hypothetical protein
MVAHHDGRGNTLDPRLVCGRNFCGRGAVLVRERARPLLAGGLHPWPASRIDNIAAEHRNFDHTHTHTHTRARGYHTPAHVDTTPSPSAVKPLRSDLVASTDVHHGTTSVTFLAESRVTDPRKVQQVPYAGNPTGGSSSLVIDAKSARLRGSLAIDTKTKKKTYRTLVATLRLQLEKTARPVEIPTILRTSRRQR